VIRAVKSGEWTQDAGGVLTAAGIPLLEGEYERRLVATDPGATAALPGGAGLVVLDIEVTPDLAAEGVVRDVVRVVQQARRDAGLEVSDRISVRLWAGPQVLDAVRAHEEFLKGETLADAIEYGAEEDAPDGAVAGTAGGGATVLVVVTRN
jgi:isoleucyl-tRNA synthetase